MAILGKIVDINLTDGKINTSAYTAELARRCLSGFGFNTEYLYRHLPPNTDPLGADNVMVLSLGLLTGTAAPSSSRVHISARSPLSGLMGSSNIGGFMGVKLLSLGIRSLIIRGRSRTPVYLQIDENGVEIHDAGALWGKDTRASDAHLKAALGDHKMDVLTIGPAGENQVLYACIMAGIDHAAGRTGMGAVMGSKNLKAISIRGVKQRTKSSPQVSALVKQYVQSIKGSTSRYHDFSTLGSAGDIKELNEQGLLGTRNYRSLQMEGADKIDGRNLTSFVKRKTSCHRCPVHCKAEIELTEGKYKGFKGGRPEYETIIDMGALCGVSDPEALLYLSNQCNIHGLDSISTGSVIAFAMDLFDRGILTPEDTGGLELTWGNADAMETLMEQIARRQGLGDILALGVKRAAEQIGHGAAKYAYHVKGVEMYGSDPRGMMGTALSYAVSLRGGDFTSVYPIPEYRFSPERATAAFGTPKAVEFTATEGKGALVRYCMIASAVIDSLGLCKVPALSIAGHFDLERETALLQALVGLEIDTPELRLIGERIINMEKLFNLRCGATREMDNLPARFVETPIGEGPSKGATADLKPMVQDFYQVMGWDPQGQPLPETIAALQIDADPMLTP